MEHGTRVLQILDELEHGDIPGAASLADAPVTESLPTPVARLPRDGDTPEPEPGAAAESDTAEKLTVRGAWTIRRRAYRLPSTQSGASTVRVPVTKPTAYSCQMVRMPAA